MLGGAGTRPQEVWASVCSQGRALRRAKRPFAALGILKGGGKRRNANPKAPEITRDRSRSI
eukprot:4799743-Alexandrium_andersonii.AAC.1